MVQSCFSLPNGDMSRLKTAARLRLESYEKKPRAPRVGARPQGPDKDRS